MAGMIFLALRAKRPKKRRRPPGSRVRKTLLPRVIELLREADNPKFDQKSGVNGYTKSQGSGQSAAPLCLQGVGRPLQCAAEAGPHHLCGKGPAGVQGDAG